MAGAIIRNPTPDWLKPENASVFDSYWKQIARKIGHGTRNYVVFPGNEHLIDILRKFGVLPPVAGLGALSQVGQSKPEPR